MAKITDLKEAARVGAQAHLGSRYEVSKADIRGRVWESLGVEYEHKDPLVMSIRKGTTSRG